MMTEAQLIQAQIDNAANARSFHLEEIVRLRRVLSELPAGTRAYTECAGQIDEHTERVRYWTNVLKQLRWK